MITHGLCAVMFETSSDVAEPYSVCDVIEITLLVTTLMQWTGNIGDEFLTKESERDVFKCNCTRV